MPRESYKTDMNQLVVGDFLPDLALLNQHQGTTRLFLRLRGKPVVLLFCPDPQAPASQAVLGGIVRHHERLAQLAHLFLVTAQAPAANAQAAAALGLPFEFILSDVTGQAARACAVAPGDQVTCFLAGPNNRVLEIARPAAEEEPAAAILARLEQLAGREALEVRPFAPVLAVPEVFDRDFCRHLIQVYETRGSHPTGVTRSQAGGRGAEVLDDQVKVRRDHAVEEPALKQAIDRYIGARVLPEIAKAFGYLVTSVELYKIACYDAASGGFFRPHRDNMSEKTRHRRFAMSLNLNTGDFEGGQLRFAEYGPHLYSPAAGEALVFSCSLLHEVLPVTAGQRYALLGFFFGAEGEQLLRRQREAAALKQ